MKRVYTFLVLISILVAGCSKSEDGMSEYVDVVVNPSLSIDAEVDVKSSTPCTGGLTCFVVEKYGDYIEHHVLSAPDEHGNYVFKVPRRDDIKLCFASMSGDVKFEIASENLFSNSLYFSSDYPFSPNNELYLSDYVECDFTEDKSYLDFSVVLYQRHCVLEFLFDVNDFSLEPQDLIKGIGLEFVIKNMNPIPDADYLYPESFGFGNMDKIQLEGKELYRKQITFMPPCIPFESKENLNRDAYLPKFKLNYLLFDGTVNVPREYEYEFKGVNARVAVVLEQRYFE